MATRIWLLCVIAAITPLSGVSANGAQSVLKQNQECMLDVLKLTPGVEIVSSHTPPVLMRSRFSYPFLEYRYQGHDILFDVQKYDADVDSYTFIAFLPTGMEPEGSSAPAEDGGTGDVEKKWKAQCGASAITITE